MKKILGFLLGAGSGVLGTLIRTGVAALGGWLIAKGFTDAATAGNLVEQISAVAVTLLAAIGSYLNNEKVEAKTEEKVVTQIATGEMNIK